jgi:CRISPR-associated protein Cmr5
MSNISNRQKIESGRAKCAYDFVKEVLNSKEAKNGNYVKDYKSYVKKLAPLIQTNGFGNTIAFVHSKSKSNKVYGKIYEQLSEWLKKKELIGKNDDLMESIVSVDSRKYRQLTTESLALINWWRRFVDGLIDDDDNK